MHAQFSVARTPSVRMRTMMCPTVHAAGLENWCKAGLERGVGLLIHGCLRSLRETLNKEN